MRRCMFPNVLFLGTRRGKAAFPGWVCRASTWCPSFYRLRFPKIAPIF